MARKIILYIACSLDGFIARKNGNINWLLHDQDYGYKKFYKGIDTVVMGQTTYQVSQGFEKEPFKDKHCFVFAKKTKKANSGHAIFVKGNVKKFIQSLNPKKHKNIWLIGGGNLVGQFLKHNLVDGFRIFVHPILLGKGIRLFNEQFKEVKLKFVKIKSFSSGLLELEYTQVKL